MTLLAPRPGEPDTAVIVQGRGQVGDKDAPEKQGVEAGAHQRERRSCGCRQLCGERPERHAAWASGQDRAERAQERGGDPLPRVAPEESRILEERPRSQLLLGHYSISQGYVAVP